jgi:RimJ/RimL family protein N-acetyltransferase
MFEPRTSKPVCADEYGQLFGNGFRRFAARSRASGSLLGMCGFLPEEEEIDFGYRYSVETWGKGIGSEAA